MSNDKGTANPEINLDQFGTDFARIRELVLKGSEILLLSGAWDIEAVEAIGQEISTRFGDSDILLILLPEGGTLDILPEEEMNMAGWFRKGEEHNG